MEIIKIKVLEFTKVIFRPKEIIAISFCIIFKKKNIMKELNRMQITSNEISNTKYMQIYLTEEELKKHQVM